MCVTLNPKMLNHFDVHSAPDTGQARVAEIARRERHLGDEPPSGCLTSGCVGHFFALRPTNSFVASVKGRSTSMTQPHLISSPTVDFRGGRIPAVRRGDQACLRRFAGTTKRQGYRAVDAMTNQRLEENTKLGGEPDPSNWKNQDPIFM